MFGQQQHQNDQSDDSSKRPQMHDNKSSYTLLRQQMASSNVTHHNSSSSLSSDALGLSNIIDGDEALRKVDSDNQMSLGGKVLAATNEKRGNNNKKEIFTSIEDRGEENRLFKQLSSQDSDNLVNRYNLTLETTNTTSTAVGANKNSSTILRDCSDQFPKPLAAANSVVAANLELRASDNRLNIPFETTTTTTATTNRQLIEDRDTDSASAKAASSQLGEAAATQHKPFAPVSQSANLIRLNPGDSRRVRFESLLAPTSATTDIKSSPQVDVGEARGSGSAANLTATTLSLDSFSTINCDNSNPNTSRLNQSQTTILANNQNNRKSESAHRALADNQETDLNNKGNQGDNHTSYDSNHQEDGDDDEEEDEEYDEREEFSSSYGNTNNKSRSSPNHELNRRYRSSYFKKSHSSSFGRRFLNSIKSLGTLEISVGSSSNSRDTDSRHPYFAYEDKDLLTGSSKYSSSAANRKRRSRGTPGRTFRGSYRYSRSAVSMAVFNKLCGLLFQRSTAALLGAFLIHVTLGTVYTLSNINSYLTSYMRKHGSPNATYGGSMWISSSYAVGQGFSMVLGGYIEKRFSARVACFIGCAMHSISIMSTSWSVNHGPLAVLITYGLIPGFGCGLAYMTPMSNGFGWYPNRKGLVAGVILAGFGIGTFIFNMAQTAYVNADNLSPPEDAGGYFTQEAILEKVPHLFVFMGSIYATMQFVGCCMLFKPPNHSDDHKLLPDERPILMEPEMSLKKAVRTREFIVLFIVYGLTTQGILFVNSMIKEYGQLFIGNDMYLAWTGSMASIANSMGRLVWGLTIDRFSFTQCLTTTTIIFGSLMFIMPFEFVLSSKLWYLVCTLGIFGSFSGWMSIYPVHLSRVFGRTNSGMIYGLIFISQSIGGIGMAFGTHYLIDHFSRFVPFFLMVFLEIVGLSVYHLFYPK